MLRKDLSYGGVGKDGNYAGETAKSHQRRLNEGWYQRYAPANKPGIDIGCGIDPINNTFYRWDSIYGDGDATFMDGIPDEMFQTVYSSHLLEHIQDPVEAVRNWWRILKPSGHLIVVVPHRDLYEQQKELPSRWNSDHKWFWLPTEHELPHTLSLAHVVGAATGKDTIFVRILDENYVNNGVDQQAGGEYSIEAVVQK
jgi:SAM-dependent methyltransferase